MVVYGALTGVILAMHSRNDNLVRRPGYIIDMPGGKRKSMVLDLIIGDDVLGVLDWNKKVVFDLMPIIFAYEMVKHNHEDLKAAIDDLRVSVSDITRIRPSEARLDTMLVISKHVSNFLASSHAFLDQTAYHLRKTYGAQSQELRAFVCMTNQLYDARFSYRFIYQLRHYTQHTNIPILGIDIDASRRSPEDAFDSNISVLIGRDELLNASFNWKPHVRSYLENQKERFCILPLIDEQMDSISRLCFKAIDQQRANLHECSVRLHQFLQALCLPKNAELVIWETESSEPPDTRKRWEHVPVYELARITRIYKQCQAFSLLPV